MLVTQSCLILCDPLDCSLPGSSIDGIFRQEYWTGLPLPPPEDLPDPGIKPTSPPGDHPKPEMEPESPVSPALKANSLPTC